MTVAGKPHHNYTEREIQQVLRCVVAWSGNIKAAWRQLKEEDDLEQIPGYNTIQDWIRGPHRELYSDLREQYSEQIERDLADRYRGVAAQAIEATELATKVATERLTKGKDNDPARSAANLAAVADKTLRDYSLLEGKPTQIQENRGISEVMRTLIDMGVLVPRAAPEIEEATEVEREDA